MFLGDFPEDFTTVTCMFTTHASTGAPVAPLTAFEAADVIIYKNGSATQKTSTNGVTMTSPFDSITGLHCLVIDTSNDTGDAAWWVAGAQYTLVLSPDTETVDSVAVAKVIGTFGIELSEVLRPVTAGRQVVVDAAGLADAHMVKVGPTGSGSAQTARDIGASVLLSSGTGTGQLKLASGYVAMTWADIAAPTTTVNLSGTTVATVTGAVGSVTGLTASDVGTIKTKTDFLPSATAGAAGGVFIAGTNAATIVTTSFTTTFTGNLTGSVASVSGAVGSVTGLTASDVGTIKTKTDFLPSATAGAAGGVFIAGTNAATTVTTSFTTTFTGNLTGNVGGNVTGSVGSVTGLTAADVGAIKTKTDQLTFTVANKVDANATHISGSSAAADNLEAGAEALIETTCAFGSSTTAIVTNLTETTDDHYNGRVITFTTGDLTGQASNITDYNGTTKTLTVTALTEAPADGVVFVIS